MDVPIKFPPEGESHHLIIPDEEVADKFVFPPLHIVAGFEKREVGIEGIITLIVMLKHGDNPHELSHLA